MTISTNERTELGNGLSHGGELYPNELRFGDLSENERRNYIRIAEQTISELTAHKGIFFERYFGRKRGSYLKFIGGFGQAFVLVMIIPILLSTRQILEGTEYMQVTDWVRCALVVIGFLLNAASLTIASSSVHTQNYWREFLILVNDPETRDHVNFVSGRPAPKYHAYSGWLQTWGILLWLAGVLFWAA